jgi:hypothetical protein
MMAAVWGAVSPSMPSGVRFVSKLSRWRGIPMAIGTSPSSPTPAKPLISTAGRVAEQFKAPVLSFAKARPLL